MEITVNIHGLDSLAQAIAAMAQAIERGQGGASTVAAASAAQAPVVPHAAAVAPATAAAASAAPVPPAPAPAVSADPVPAVPAAPAAPAVPLATAPQQYRLAELQKAVMPLLDAGRMADLQQVLAKYGAQDLTKVPADQYGALAADFRALGARL